MMKHYSILFISLFAVGLLQAQNNTSGQTKNNNTDVKQKVLRVERNIKSAMMTGDTIQLKAAIADDYKGYYNGNFLNKEIF